MKIFLLFSSLTLSLFLGNSAWAGPPWLGGVPPGWLATGGPPCLQAGASGLGLGGQGFAANKAAFTAAGVGGGGVGPVIISTIAGGAAGFGTAKLMNDYLYSDCQNQNACEAAKVGTLAGAATGTAGIVATVAAVGADAMGLATIGATVGGGMAAGAAVLVAAPVVAAVAIGGATYWWFSSDGENNGNKPYTTKGARQ